MSQERWNITMIISKKKGEEPAHFQSFKLEVDPEEYVLDAVERVWAFHDRSLTFRHACHHSTCGACGMRVNGVEKLTCITLVDLVVDMSDFYNRMEEASAAQVVPVRKSALPYEHDLFPDDGMDHERLTDCIECGCCVSACPIALTTPAYLGPAVLAAAQQTHSLSGKPCIFDLVDTADGVWRCHSGFECTAVCPSNVDPAWRIMDMRRRVIGHRIKHLFGAK
jgi:succinate dehydrogenase / fumarate reductase iron-sulfur subunit